MTYVDQFMIDVLSVGHLRVLCHLPQCLHRVSDYQGISKNLCRCRGKGRAGWDRVWQWMAWHQQGERFGCSGWRALRAVRLQDWVEPGGEPEGSAEC